MNTDNLMNKYRHYTQIIDDNEVLKGKLSFDAYLILDEIQRLRTELNEDKSNNEEDSENWLG